MYTVKKNSIKELILRGLQILIITLVIPQLLVAQYNVPTYDRKPMVMHEDPEETIVSIFEVYPTQTDGELNIVMGDFIGQSVEIFIQDKKGKVVLHQRIDQLNVGFQWLDLNDYNLSDGEYIVTVLNNGNSFNAEMQFTGKK